MLVARRRGMRRIAICALASALALAAATVDAQTAKLDTPLIARSAILTGRSPVLIRPIHPLVDLLIKSVGGTLGRSLPSVNARVADVPNAALTVLAGNALVQRIALDRQAIGMNERTGVTVGATAVRAAYGYDGSGVGVAIIDSGVAASHDDL